MIDVMIHPVFISAAAAWLVAQTIKGIIYIIKHGKIGENVLTRTGGMPSAHSAFMMGASTAIYMRQGVSDLFAVSLCFSLIVMVDAFGLRQQVGHQARFLNILAKEFRVRLGKRLRKEGLQVFLELVGHSGVQVGVGALVGIAVGVIVYFV